MENVVEEEKEEEEEEEKAEKAEEQMIKTPSKKADDKNKALLDTADKTAHELGKANKDDQPAAVDKGGGQSFLGLLQQKQQAASGTYFADKGKGLAHEVPCVLHLRSSDASSVPAHKKPKVVPTTAVTTTEAQPEAQGKQPKAQPKSKAQPNPLPKSSEEQPPKRQKTKR